MTNAETESVVKNGTEMIETLIETTLKTLRKKVLPDIYKTETNSETDYEGSGYYKSCRLKNEDSAIVFPVYRDGKLRISEQETRFAFITEVIKGNRGETNNKFLYSVETPTKRKYRFSPGKANASGTPKIDEDTGQSAMVDVCLYSKAGEKYYVEFKAKNVGGSAIEKDFLKLLCDDENAANYFVHTIYEMDDNILSSIANNYTKALESIRKKHKNEKGIKLIVFLYYLDSCKEPPVKMKMIMEKNFKNKPTEFNLEPTIKGIDDAWGVKITFPAFPV